MDRSRVDPRCSTGPFSIVIYIYIYVHVYVCYSLPEGKWSDHTRSMVLVCLPTFVGWFCSGNCWHSSSSIMVRLWVYCFELLLSMGKSKSLWHCRCPPQAWDRLQSLKLSMEDNHKRLLGGLEDAFYSSNLVGNENNANWRRHMFRVSWFWSRSEQSPFTSSIFFW